MNWFLFAAGLACYLGIIVFSIRLATKTVADRTSHHQKLSRPETIYICLCYMGVCAIHLLSPRHHWETTFYGVMFVICIGLGTLSTYLQLRKPKPRTPHT